MPSSDFTQHISQIRDFEQLMIPSGVTPWVEQYTQPTHPIDMVLYLGCNILRTTHLACEVKYTPSGLLPGPVLLKVKEDLTKEKVINGIGCLLGQDSILQNRRTIVFVHGSGGNHQMWIPQMEYLSLKYNTVAINLPGRGLGQRKGETTIAGYVNAVHDFIDGLDLKKVVLAGLSMGGAITQEFALTYPERLSAIILFSTGAKLKVMPEMFEMIRNNFEAYISFFPQFAFAKSTRQEVIEPALEEARRCDPEVVYGDFQACDKFNLLARIKEIKIPCLIFSGTEDKPRCCIKMRANQMVVPIKRRFPISYGYFLKATLGLIQGMTLIPRLFLPG
jgi:pimeloyl-ACP methyl ester carboxylesterase